jgi:hypothetical protein
MSTKFKDLNLNSAFLFSAAANDPETCQLLLELILGRKIPKVSVKTEHSILPESFVIFICTFDPFNRGLYRYTFVERCEEDGEPLGDGTCKIFLNTKGKNVNEVPIELIIFLGYFENSTDEYVKKVNNPSISRLHEKIITLKKSREWEEGYMQLEEFLIEQQQLGREEGRALGREEGLKEGLKEALQSILSTKGEVSINLHDRILNETNVSLLSKWIEKALVVTNIKEFEKEILDK